MTTLTQTAILTKKIFLFGSIFFVLIITSWISYQYWYYNIYLPSLKPVEEKPTIAFGKLPRPFFLEDTIPSSVYSYVIDTPTGSLPNDFPKIMNVYFIPQLPAGFNATDKAKRLAESLGFLEGPEILSLNQYGYTNSQGGNLVVDITTGNFNFNRYSATSSATINIPEEEQILELPSEQIVIEQFKSYLISKGLLKDLLGEGPSKVVYDKTLPRDSTQATISLWPAKLNNYDVVTKSYSTGLANALVIRSSNQEDRYIKIDYANWLIEQGKPATYPLKTVDEAFTDLEKGNNTSIVQEPTGSRVSIFSVRLAYFMSQEYFPFVEPVYVFEGERFAAYVPAIRSEYISF